MKTASLVFLCLSVSCIALPEDLDLVKDGATPYQIVKSDEASPVDEYAAGKLAEYLKQITGVEFAVTFPYLTVDNIYRWQQLFDKMEQKTAGHPEHLLNVRTVRRELDFATLWKWFELRKQHPEYFRDHRTHVQRITAVNDAKTPSGLKPRPLGKSALEDFVAVIQGGGQEKPLPSQFDGIDKSRIRTFIPTNKARVMKKRVVDPDAAFGFAATVHLPDLPFQFGFFQWKTRQPPTGNHGPRRSLDLKEITPGSYRLYKLGTITVTPDSLIWFSAKSWLTNLNAGKRLFEPGADNQWESWISLKFDGPSYRGKAEKDLVLCDRIILVRKEA
ncbi:MAG: hypothetical protein QGF00_03020 [Planctomycetota bacterium]|jgi:hypothetical protein|nr:hypothetical protein [Planctomycetota bacterium]